MFGLGVPELIIIFLIILLLFGGKNLPELTRNFTKSIKMFEKGIKETEIEEESLKNDINLN